MTLRKEFVIDLIENMVDGNPTTARQRAEMIVDRLMEEGLLHLGYGDAEVDMVVEKFKDTFGTTKTSKQDRWAANRLVQKYGSQAVVGIIGLLGGLGQEKYAPVVNSVAELEGKWSSILNFLRKQKGTEEIAL